MIGKHPFSDHPAPPTRLSNDARILLIGDWATGLLAPPEVEGRARPAAEAAERFDSVTELLRDHQNALISPSPGLAAPPDEVAAWLDAAEPMLRRVAEQLTADVPRWDLFLDRGLEYRIPALIDHIHLHRLLVLEAGEAARVGDTDTTADWLHAARVLRIALADDPLLIHQLVILAEHKRELALLRALPSPPEDWEVFVAPEPARDRIHRALRLEGRMMVQALRTGHLEAEVGEEPLVRWIAGPMLRHGAAQHVESMEHGVARLEREDPRYFRNDQFFAEEEARVPRWNIVARLLLPNFFDASIKAARHELDVDLTRRALEVRAVVERLGQQPAGHLRSLRSSAASP
jgi:hypothetical protein